jgi:hypothetical protein
MKMELTSKENLLGIIKNAVEQNTGFALGKIGFSEQFFLNHPLFMKTQPSLQKQHAYQLVANVHCLRQSGVFPSHLDFLTRFSTFYSNAVDKLDVLGLFGAPLEKTLIHHYQFSAHLVKYRDTEPDRSIPNNTNFCYLPFFENKRVLLIAPFGHFLKERAKQSIFEDVWLNTGKPWFKPSLMDSIEFPYAYELQTQKKFGDVLNLYEYICQKIDTKDFDVALIAAGALAIPLATYIKSKKRSALSLGGHLQVLFGVKGARWKNDPEWVNQYFNESWVDMPVKYHPHDKNHLTDHGAYW